MTGFNYGVFFKNERTKRGLSQAEIADMVSVDKQTISKIERGEQNPRRDTMELFCQKLGIVGERFYDVNKFEQFEMHEIKEQIKKASAQNNHKLALKLRDKLLQEYKYECQTKPMQQFLIWAEAVNGKRIGRKIVQYSCEEKMDLYNQAICCTMPDFDENLLENMLLGLDEITLVMNLAGAYMENGNNKKAGMLYDKLLRYVETHLLPISESCDIIPVLTYNYSRFLGRTGNQKKCLRVAEKGLESCRLYRKPGMLGELLMNKACAMEKLSIGDKGLAAATESYYILRTLNSSDYADRALKYIRETYGCEPSYQPVQASSKI